MDPTARSVPVTTVDGLTLDAELAVPARTHRAVAVVTHPHPLMGGDRTSPVPDGLWRGLAAAGVAALRFDFRGTGQSDGTHAGGVGEQDDVRAAIDAAVAAVPGVPVLGVGYSFGADVLLATADPRLALVVAVAPPLRVLPPESLAAPRGGAPTLVLSPAHDQFCPPEVAREATAGWPATTVEAIEGADHFLAGAVARVVERVLAALDGVAP